MEIVNWLFNWTVGWFLLFWGGGVRYLDWLVSGRIRKVLGMQFVLNQVYSYFRQGSTFGFDFGR